MKKVAVRVFVFLAAAGVMLLALEGAVRVLHANTNLISVSTQEPPTFLLPDDELHHVPAPNFGPMDFRVEHVQYELSTNEFGCFDEPYREEEPYILLLGDSFSHHLAPIEETWGAAAEKELGVQVLHCGVSAYTTPQELGFAKRIISEIGKEPEIIIVGYFLNDFAEETKLNATASPVAVKKSNPAAQTSRWLFNNSSLFRLARIPAKTALLSTPMLGDWLLARGFLQKQATSLDQMLLYEEVQESEALQEQWQGHVESMKAFQKFANDQESELLFVIIPWKFQVYDFFLASEIPDSTEREQVIAEPGEILGSVFEREGIRFLDLLPLFRERANLEPRKYLVGEEDLFYRFDLHWSPNGQRLAGKLTAEYIKSNHEIYSLLSSDD